MHARGSNTDANTCTSFITSILTGLHVTIVKVQVSDSNDSAAVFILLACHLPVCSFVRKRTCFTTAV